MEPTKNLCAQIAESLHAKVLAEKEKSGKRTLGEYVDMVLREYYENEKGGSGMENERTLAFKLPVEMIEALDALIKRRGCSKKKFMQEVIQRVLDEAAEVEKEVTEG